eukprot:4225092-Lingulodinium_polyedra.AAC.1
MRRPRRHCRRSHGDRLQPRLPPFASLRCCLGPRLVRGARAAVPLRVVRGAPGPVVVRLDSAGPGR